MKKKQEKSKEFKKELSAIDRMVMKIKGKIINEIEKQIIKTGADEITLDESIVVQDKNPLFYDSYADMHDSIFGNEDAFCIDILTIDGVFNSESDGFSFSELDTDILIEILEEIEKGKFSLSEDEENDDEEDE